MEIKNFKKYLEMITSERLRKEGFTPHKSKVLTEFPIPIKILGIVSNYNNMEQDYINGQFTYEEYQDWLKKFLEAVNDGTINPGISSNKINRVVLTPNNVIYSGDVNDCVHDQILGKMIYDNKLIVPDEIFEDWNVTEKSYNYFLCLQQSRFNYTDFYFSESYYDDIPKQVKKYTVTNKYNKILKTINPEYKIIFVSSQD